MPDTLTRTNAKELVAKRGITFDDLDDFEEAPSPPPKAEVIAAPTVSRVTGKPKPQPRAFIRGRHPHHHSEVFTMSPYAKSLIVTGATKFVELTDNAANAPFKNNNLERDTFIARTLYENDHDPKKAAAKIEQQMLAARVPRLVISSVIEQMCYAVLKNAMFTGFINWKQAIRASEGAMPDSFFAGFNRAPAAENCEVDDSDVKAAPIDHREEQVEPPYGLSETHITLNGVEFPLDGVETLSSQVVDGLEDARLHLENIILSYNKDFKGRLAFFVSQTPDGKWQRHDGSAAMALLDFEEKMEARNIQKARQLDAFYVKANEEARAAA